MTTVQPRRRRTKERTRDRHQHRGTSAPPEGRRQIMRPLRSMAPLKVAAGVLGVAFLLLGVLGFVPAVTTDYGEMTFADPRSGAMLFGAFRVTVLANIVHLVLGVAGLAAAGIGAAARWYLLLGGVVSLLLWMASIAIDPLDAHLNVVALGAPHGWLHFVLGTVMVALGGLLSAVRAPAARRA